jgi:hypothetical protein
MAIPNAALAVVPPEKLTGYLLDVSHPVGGSKARWLISFGYQPNQPQVLADDMLDVVRGGDTFSSEESPFGVKYLVPGQLVTPSGRSVNIVTVWITEARDPRPRFVTAYPGRRATDA